MDDIFAASNPKNPFDVVLVERRTPRRYDAHGNLLALHPADPETAIVSGIEELGQPDKELEEVAKENKRSEQQVEKIESADKLQKIDKVEQLVLRTETSPVLD